MSLPTNIKHLPSSLPLPFPAFYQLLALSPCFFFVPLNQLELPVKCRIEVVRLICLIPNVSERDVNISLLHFMSIVVFS